MGNTKEKSYYDYFLNESNTKQKAKEVRLHGWAEYETIKNQRDEIRAKYLNMPEFSNKNKNTI